jgi:hypothetical protein
MTKLDATAEITLELAHGAREPSAAEKARNLAAIRARLGVVPVPSGAPVLRAGAPGAGARSPLRSALPRVLSAAAITGVVGFLIGLNMGHALSERASGITAAARVAAAPAVAVASPPTPVAVPSPAPPVAEVSSNVEAPGPQPAKARLKSRSVKGGEGRAVRARPADSDPAFLEAVRLLRRAQRAARTGDGAVGSSLLDQLDEHFPKDVLQEERQATRVLCWCASGEVERAQSLARELLEHNPRSIYARRIRQSCAASALESTLVEPSRR